MAHFLLVVDDTGSPNTDNAALETILENAGHTVTLIAASSAAPADMSPYDCVVVGPSLLAIDLGTKYTALATPLVYVGTNGNVGTRLNFIDTNTHFSTTGVTDLEIVDAAHEIAGDLSGTVTCYNANETIGQCAPSNLGAGRQVVVQRVSTPGAAVVVGWESGGTMGAGTAAGRRAWSGMRGDFSEYTGDGRTLLLQTFEWAANASSSGSETVTATLVDSFTEDDNIVYTIDTGETDSDFNDPFTDTLSRSYFIGTRELEDARVFTEQLVVQVNGATPQTGVTGGRRGPYNNERNRRMRRELAGSAR